MELELLRKEDFGQDSVLRGKPGIRFDRSGLISINKSAVKHLKLSVGDSDTLAGVSFLRDLKRSGDLFIMRDEKGWELRYANKEKKGIVVFNNVALCHHVIDLTWGRQGVSHAVGEEKPGHYCFGIALLPVDDGKNKNVFALLRKKD
jgi:hypothetical protein